MPMRRVGFYLAVVLAIVPLGTIWAESPSTCGDNHITCGGEETCCEHIVAYYSPQGSQGASAVEGQCLPQGQKCNSFWCGAQHCEAGFWGTPKVCCVDPRSGGMPDYQCARSELNCPGNTETLTIREKTLPERILKGS